jgi:hypothetical protein
MQVLKLEHGGHSVDERARDPLEKKGVGNCQSKGLERATGDLRKLVVDAERGSRAAAGGDTAISSVRSRAVGVGWSDRRKGYMRPVIGGGHAGVGGTRCGRGWLAVGPLLARTARGIGCSTEESGKALRRRDWALLAEEIIGGGADGAADGL